MFNPKPSANAPVHYHLSSSCNSGINQQSTNLYPPSNAMITPMPLNLINAMVLTQQSTSSKWQLSFVPQIKLICLTIQIKYN